MKAAAVKEDVLVTAAASSLSFEAKCVCAGK